MMTDAARRKRDKRLRRALLEALDYTKRHGPVGEIDGTTLFDTAAAGLPPQQGFEDEDHCISLIRDLVNKSYASERFEDLRRNQRYTLRHMRLKITSRGSDLLEENLPADPAIDDERITAGGE